MLRRIGYTLGLLFVLACVAAYPLTWGRQAVLGHTKGDRTVNVMIRSGSFDLSHLVLQILDPKLKPTTHKTGWDVRLVSKPGYTHPPDNWKALVRPGFLRDDKATPRFAYRSYVLSVPLWMPALAASLFMAWRWRRRRTRSGAGFPMGTGSATMPPDRAN
jgi:hypothetical protein